jgi:hypothetical protein
MSRCQGDNTTTLARDCDEHPLPARFPSSNPLPKYFFTSSFGFETPSESVAQAALRFYRTLTLEPMSA